MSGPSGLEVGLTARHLGVEGRTRCLSIAGAATLTAVFFLLANDGHHHWHEFREIHSARFYSNAELLRGAFDPGPSPLRSPDEVATWYATKLLHIEALRRLVALFGIGLSALWSIQFVYAAMLPVAAALGSVALRNIGLPRGTARVTAAAALFSPVGLYLGFKTLGDVPALLLASAAAALFTAGLRRPVRVFPLGAGAGVCAALSAMASWTGLPLVLGLGGAVLASPPHAARRGTVVLAIAVSTFSGALCLAAGVVWLGGSIEGYWASLVAFMAFSKPLPMWLFAVFSIGLSGGLLWVFVPLCWLAGDARLRAILLVWVGIAGLVALVLGGGFLEPRYLVGGIVPLAGLAVMGAQAALERARRAGYSVAARNAAATVLAVSAVVSTAAVQPIIPYELNQRELARLVREQASSASVAILTPWNYSDFHFLAFAFPNLPVYLVQSAATEAGDLVDDAAWTARFATMYGDRYLAGATALSSALGEKRVLYVGWTVLPSFKNLQTTLRAIGLRGLAEFVAASQVRNHMVESWLIGDTHYTMQAVAEYGQYHVYAVSRR